MVIAEIGVPVTTHTGKKRISYRNTKAINLEAFKADILESELITSPSENASDLASQYEDCLSSILNKHAPVKTKYVSPALV